MHQTSMNNSTWSRYSKKLDLLSTFQLLTKEYNNTLYYNSLQARGEAEGLQ